MSAPARSGRAAWRARVAAALVAGAAALLPAQAQAAAKPQGAAATPLLKPVRKAHCTTMYDIVAKRLTGASATVSNATRNGLKDFFVTRPGVIDCKGQREIPWVDGKDHEFIDAVIKATNDAFKKSKLNMGRAYGVGPAPTPVAAPAKPNP